MRARWLRRDIHCDLYSYVCYCTVLRRLLSLPTSHFIHSVHLVPCVMSSYLTVQLYVPPDTLDCTKEASHTTFNVVIPLPE